MWSVAGNWSAGLPNNTSDVDFTSGTYTATVDGGPWTIDGLDVNVSTVTLKVDVFLEAGKFTGNDGSIIVDNGGTLILDAFNSNSGVMTVKSGGTLDVKDLKNNNGTVTVETGGLVEIDNDGTGNFTVNGGTLKIGDDYAGSAGTITMNSGTLWLADKLGQSSYVLGGSSQIFFGNAPGTITNSFTDASKGDRFAFKGTTITSAAYVGTQLKLHTTTGSDIVFTNITLSAAEVAGATFSSTTFAGSDYGFIQMACYCRGTMILTETGEVPVEALAVGDRVLTLSNGPRPVRWIGHRAYDRRFIGGAHGVLPICVAADALAEGVPTRDLWLSPEHSLCIDDVLVQAMHIVNGATVTRAEQVDLLEYFHIELDSHDVIVANGAAAETYVDCDNRLMFANGADYLALHPEDDGPRWQFCLPRLEADSEQLMDIRARLLERATALGHSLRRDCELHLLVDGAVVVPIERSERHCRFTIARGARQVCIASRVSVPAEIDAASLDVRRLGVPLERIVLSDAAMSLEIAHTHPELNESCHPDEETHRWTNGRASLPARWLSPFSDAISLDVYLAPNTLGYHAGPGDNVGATAEMTPFSAAAAAVAAVR